MVSGTQTPSLHLTKSRFTAGQQCSLRLWSTAHAPIPRPPQTTAQRMGDELGELARLRFPEGVFIDQPPWARREALSETQAHLERKGAVTIFEAAFEFDNLFIRADILHRTAEGYWHLLEVKGGSAVKPYYVQDAAIQAWVLESSGILLASISILHPDKTYIRGDQLSVQDLFTEVDITDLVRGVLPALPPQIDRAFAVLASETPPAVEPGSHCTTPVDCEFWDRCTASKPVDWVFKLPRVGQKMAEFASAGIESIRAIPPDFPLSAQHRIVREVLISGVPYLGSGLTQALAPARAAMMYLDFEAISPAVPIYPGTRPFERVPFQWSLHVRRADGSLAHHEYLASGEDDPRFEFAETLMSTIGEYEPLPIGVYSSYEAVTLKLLCEAFPALALKLGELIARLVDFLPIVRAQLYFEGFNGSFSIKSVGPALIPDFTYDDLKVSETAVADGGQAAFAFERLILNRLAPDEDPSAIRAALLRYCQRDTEALVRLHEALLDLARISHPR